MKYWIFQCNPDNFDINSYLLKWKDIYWSVKYKKHREQIHLDDPVFIWRTAGKKKHHIAGIIAFGHISEPCCHKDFVKYPERLGESISFETSEIKVGVSLTEVRLSERDGMLVRNQTKPALSESAIIKAGPGTNFSLKENEYLRLLELWDDTKKRRVWTNEEVDTIVENYFEMLRMELSGIPYNKTAHRNQLIPKLPNRSENSIEFKHQNISAVLIDKRLPYIDGYKPKWNYQYLLVNAVDDYLNANLDIYELISDEVPEAIIGLKSVKDVFEESPKKKKQKKIIEGFRPTPRDIIYRESVNKKLGLKGEEFVIIVEKLRLKECGREDLSEMIEHISIAQGDGAGYDILSYNEDETERFIEVKTSRYGKETPFYISANEVAFSRDYAKNYFLYRVFNFIKSPKIFIIPGSIEHAYSLNPTQYVVTI